MIRSTGSADGELYSETYDNRDTGFEDDVAADVYPPRGLQGGQSKWIPPRCHIKPQRAPQMLPTTRPLYIQLLPTKYVQCDCDGSTDVCNYQRGWADDDYLQFKNRG